MVLPIFLVAGVGALLVFVLVTVMAITSARRHPRPGDRALAPPATASAPPPWATAAFLAARATEARGEAAAAPNAPEVVEAEPLGATLAGADLAAIEPESRLVTGALKP